MTMTNILAAIVIAILLFGGGAALYRLDNAQGNRTSKSISAKAASDASSREA
jgi:hypothetical protein